MGNTQDSKLLVSTDIDIKDFYDVYRYGLPFWVFKVRLSEGDKRQIINLINQKYPNGVPISNLENAKKEIGEVVLDTVVKNTCGYCSQFGHTVDPDTPEGYPAHCPKLPPNYNELVETLHEKYGLEKWKISSMILKRVGGARPLPGGHDHIIWNPNDLELAVIRMAVTMNHLTGPTKATTEIKAKL